MSLLHIADKVRSAFTADYWPEWESVPFSILLVADDYEYVLNDKSSDTTFLFGCDSIQYRPGNFNKRFLATFPLINWKPTIVIGTPENTDQSPEGWVITLIHEHFHQLQFAHPDYYAAQKKLRLAKGDETGMWMLNHPYPYDSAEVISQVKKISSNLLRIYAEDEDLHHILKDHRKLKAELAAITGAEHHRYLNLQLWQEGFSRFIETSILREWLTNFELVDQSLFTKEQLETLLEKYHTRIRRDLTQGDLKEMKREYFYSLGAAEAMLIEYTNPEWRKEYFEQLYTTDHLLD